MEKYGIVAIASLVLSFVLFIAGLATSNVMLGGVGGIFIIFAAIIFKIGQYEEKRSSLLQRMENKDHALLPLFKATVKKREVASTILSITVLVIIIAFLIVMLNSYFFKMSNIDLDKAIKDGCAKLNMGDTCITEPAKIIVPYDVNGDGRAGGDGDTFSSLMAAQNCTGSCVMKRCGCPG
jgi:hypothetical protein